MAEFDTLKELLAQGADDAVAIGAPEREPLNYAGLRRLAAATVQSLNALGIGRNDRVAIVLPNGPEMAAAFVAIACRRHHRAAQPRLSRRRVRFLSVRSEAPRRW